MRLESLRCTNTTLVDPLIGLNTLFLTAAANPVPDVVALAATPHNDGVVSISGVNGTGVFAVATANVGDSRLITAFADTGSVILPVTLAICATDPASGARLGPPSNSVTTQINAGATPTFGVFVTGQGNVPAAHRIFVRFRSGDGVIRGATSVGVRTQ